MASAYRRRSIDGNVIGSAEPSSDVSAKLHRMHNGEVYDRAKPWPISEISQSAPSQKQRRRRRDRRNVSLYGEVVARAAARGGRGSFVKLSRRARAKWR